MSSKSLFNFTRYVSFIVIFHKDVCPSIWVLINLMEIMYVEWYLEFLTFYLNQVSLQIISSYFIFRYVLM